MNTEQKDIELLEATFKSGMLWLVLGSLISADSNMTAEECEKNIELSDNFLKAIDKAEKIPESERVKIKEHLSDGIRILKQDLSRFKKEKEEGN